MITATTASPLSALPPVQSPCFAVFCDFDESFFAHEQTPATRRDIHALRHWLEANVTKHEILFGFVTGSNIESVIEKLCRLPAAFLPHFVGPSLGSELHLANGTSLIRCRQFSSKLCPQAEFEGALEHLLRTLADHGIHLQRQGESNHGMLKRSYYFPGGTEEEEREFLNHIAPLSDQCGLSAHCNRCNPSSGDPEGWMDVDLAPKGAGKAAIVNHVLETFGIPRARAWAFGDSGNDIGMLKAVGNPFCIANATTELKRTIEPCTTRTYAGGILEILQRVFG